MKHVYLFIYKDPLYVKTVYTRTHGLRIPFITWIELIMTFQFERWIH